MVCRIKGVTQLNSMSGWNWILGQKLGEFIHKHHLNDAALGRPGDLQHFWHKLLNFTLWYAFNLQWGHHKPLKHQPSMVSLLYMLTGLSRLCTIKQLIATTYVSACEFNFTPFSKALNIYWSWQHLVKLLFSLILALTLFISF